MFRHACLRLPGIALALAALGFLGLGPQPPESDWGLILAEGLPYVERAPLVVLVPAGALIILSIFSVSLSSLTIDLRGGRARVSGRRKPLRNITSQRTELIGTIAPKPVPSAVERTSSTS